MWARGAIPGTPTRSDAGTRRFEVERPRYGGPPKNDKDNQTKEAAERCSQKP